MPEYRLSKECGEGTGALKVGEVQEQLENLCKLRPGKVALLDCAVITCSGPNPDGTCGARCAQGPVLEAVDLSATFSPGLPL